MRRRPVELEQQVEEAQTISEELEATNQELFEANDLLGEAQREAERAAARVREVLDSLTDAVSVFDHEWRWTYLNPAARSVLASLGRDPDTAIGAVLWAQLPELIGTRYESETLLADVLEGYGTIVGRWLDLRAYPADDGGVIAYFQDITDRRRQQDASTFLAEASRLLSSSANYRDTLANLARSSIPRLGDWCAVDLLERGNDGAPSGLERVALVHEDASKVALAEQYRLLYPPDLGDEQPRGLVDALGGRSVLIPVITEEMLAAGARDAQHLAMIRSLGLVSIMVVPLIAGSTVLGAITLCTGESGRHYDEADLRLAEDLASRAASAVEHARLLENAEAANAAKSEFLRTVSHERRQPLNAIGGLLQLWELGLRGELNPQQERDIERIKRNQQQLSGLIEDLLSFARLEAGKHAGRGPHRRLVQCP